MREQHTDLLPGAAKSRRRPSWRWIAPDPGRLVDRAQGHRPRRGRQSDRPRGLGTGTGGVAREVASRRNVADISQEGDGGATAVSRDVAPEARYLEGRPADDQGLPCRARCSVGTEPGRSLSAMTLWGSRRWNVNVIDIEAHQSVADRAADEERRVAAAHQGGADGLHALVPEPRRRNPGRKDRSSVQVLCHASPIRLGIRCSRQHCCSKASHGTGRFEGIET
jgi:hypothetical protein